MERAASRSQAGVSSVERCHVAKRRAEIWPFRAKNYRSFPLKKVRISWPLRPEGATPLSHWNPSLFGSNDDALGDLFRRDDGSSARGRVVRAPRRPSRRLARVSSVHERKKWPEHLLAPPRPDDASGRDPVHAHARARTEPRDERFHPRYPLQGCARRSAGAPPPRVAVASYNILRTLAERVERPADTPLGRASFPVSD